MWLCVCGVCAVYKRTTHSAKPESVDSQVSVYEKICFTMKLSVSFICLAFWRDVVHLDLDSTRVRFTQFPHSGGMWSTLIWKVLGSDSLICWHSRDVVPVDPESSGMRFAQFLTF